MTRETITPRQLIQRAIARDPDGARQMIPVGGIGEVR